jgi:hypothetical protein
MLNIFGARILLSWFLPRTGASGPINRSSAPNLEPERTCSFVILDPPRLGLTGETTRAAPNCSLMMLCVKGGPKPSLSSEFFRQKTTRPKVGNAIFCQIQCPPDGFVSRRGGLPCWTESPRDVLILSSTTWRRDIPQLQERLTVRLSSNGVGTTGMSPP